MFLAGKRGRPSIPKESDNEKKCLEYYQKWKSAAFTADKLGLNRHTVEKYFKKFKELEIEEKEEEFIQRQRMAKNLCLGKLDAIIDHLETQIERYTNVLTKDDETENDGDAQRIEAHMTKVATELSSLYQQKADLEMTATLDINVAKLAQEKYDEYINKENN